MRRPEPDRPDSPIDWRPELLDPRRREDGGRIAELLQSGSIAPGEPEIRRQLRELFECRDPTTKGNEAEQWRRATSHVRDIPIAQYGTWVHYPWSRRLVQVLPENEFHEVRNSRNQYKITPEEQKLLRARRVGIVGLSVGYSVAATMAMEGCAGEYRLADPDIVALSNLNRLAYGVGDLGVNKAVLAARRMYEMDPYLRISIFTGGVTEDSADLFMLEGGKLDLLVEECDDLFMKVFLRERARALRIPTIMETNDRGLLDLELFDVEPERPVLHGLLGTVRARDLKKLSAKQKIPFILKLLGEGGMSRRLAASLVEIDKTIVSWPQLASGATLGGAVAADAARRILLNQLETSGRFYVDVEDLVSNARGYPGGGGVAAPQTDGSSDPRTEHAAPNQFPQKSLPNSQAELVRRLVAAGSRAPSGGNCQPWRFVWTPKSTLLCIHDQARSESFLDFQHRGAQMSIGAAVENIRLEALSAGFVTEIVPFPGPDRTVICEVALQASTQSPSSQELDLAQVIEKRSTNRRLGPRVPLATEDIHALQRAAASNDAHLQLLTSDDTMAEIGAILGAGDRFRFFSEPLYREMMNEMRWSSGEAAQTRDGVDINGLELREEDEAGLRLLKSRGVVEFLKRLGAARALEEHSRRAVDAASAVALLTIQGESRESFVAGGRALQRLWLSATLRGLAIQPMSSLPYLFARLEQGSGFEAQEVVALTTLRNRYKQLFEVRKGYAELLLFRIAKVGPPRVRSLRRTVDEILVFE